MFKKIDPNLAVLLSTLLWGTYWIPLRYIDSAADGSVWLNATSFFILFLILSPIFLKNIKTLIKSNNAYQLKSNFFAALAMVLYSEALLRVDIAHAVLFFYLAPSWGTILGRIYLGNPITLKRIIAIIIGFTGLIIVLGVDEGVFYPQNIGDIMALLSGVSWALSSTYFNLAEKTAVFNKIAFTSFFMVLLFISLAILPEGRNFNFSLNMINEITIIWMLAFALIWLLPSIALVYYSVQILDPGRLNILLTFEVIVGLFSAALLTSEVIDFRVIMGAILIIMSGTIDIVIKDKATSQ